MRKNAVLSLVCFATCFSAHAQEVSSQSAEVARAFDFPPEKLVATDKTSQGRNEAGNAVLSATLFSSTDESFAPVYEVVTKGGFLLTAELKSRFEADNSGFQKAELPGGVEVFTGVLGFGPGGEGYVSLAHIPASNVDVQFKVDFSSNTPPVECPGTEAYQARIKDGASIQNSLATILGSSVKTLTESPPEPSLEPARASKVSTLAPEPQKSQPSPVAATKAQALAGTTSSEPSIGWLLILGSVLLVGGIAVFLFSKRRKSP